MYFYEDAPQYHVVAAGSLLGVAIQAHISFPVGKVSFLDLYPMTFKEFIGANGDNALVDLLHSGDWDMVTTPGFPLKGYEDLSAFKVFLADIGLLAAMSDIDASTLLDGNTIFTEFKGALTEQYVFQQLTSSPELVLFYWSADRSTAEVDFVIQHQGRIFPVEVKAEENLHAKSLKVYHEKFAPPVSIRTSMSDYRTQNWLINLPLYAISELIRIGNPRRDA